MTGVSIRVICPCCHEWAQLFLDHPTEDAVQGHHRPEVVMLACPNQNQSGHSRPTEAQLNQLVPAALEV